jgi:hypothetical protein
MVQQQEVTCMLSAFHSWLLLYICDLSGGNIIIDNYGCYQKNPMNSLFMITK